jgi:hypothetical protein
MIGNETSLVSRATANAPSINRHVVGILLAAVMRLKIYINMAANTCLARPVISRSRLY